MIPSSKLGNSNNQGKTPVHNSSSFKHFHSFNTMERWTSPAKNPCKGSLGMGLRYCPQYLTALIRNRKPWSLGLHRAPQNIPTICPALAWQKWEVLSSPSISFSSFLAHHFSEVFHLTLAISAFLYPSQSHHGPLLRWVTLIWTQQKKPWEARSINKMLSALTAGAQPLPALTSERTSPSANSQTVRRGEKEWRKISTFWRKLSGHQRTPHSQNSSITLARLVCLVNLVLSPYDNTVFGQQTAGTAQHLALQSFITTVPLILRLAFSLLSVQC